MRRIFLICIIAAALTSCKKSNVQNNGEVQLNQCLQKEFGSETVYLCFDSLLEESRCPRNARCIWQGFALVKFTFKESGQQHSVKLSTITMQGIPSKDTTISGYTIRLLNVLPYPGDTPIPVSAKVEITR